MFRTLSQFRIPHLRQNLRRSCFGRRHRSQMAARSCALRSIRHESRTQVAEMTELIANKRELTNCFGHIDRRIENGVNRGAGTFFSWLRGPFRSVKKKLNSAGKNRARNILNAPASPSESAHKNLNSRRRAVAPPGNAVKDFGTAERRKKPVAPVFVPRITRGVWGDSP